VTESEFWLAVRQAVLMFLDVLERRMIDQGWLSGPRTAELRKEAKRQP
jgi:hypothetical protein